MKRIFLILITSIITLLSGSTIAFGATSYTSEVANINILGDDNKRLNVPLYVLKTSPDNIGLKCLVINNRCGNLFTIRNTSLLGINGGYSAAKNENGIPQFYLCNIAVENGKSVMPTGYGGTGETGRLQETIVYDSSQNKVFMGEYYRSKDIIRDIKSQSRKWWAQSSDYAMYLEDESKWKGIVENIPSYNQRYNYGKEIRRSGMVYGLQGTEYKVWLIGTSIGCTANEFRNAVLSYGQSKANLGDNFKDGILLDGAYVSQMRIGNGTYYPKDASKARPTPEVIYLIDTK
jgi:hypothetical protein